MFEKQTKNIAADDQLKQHEPREGLREKKEKSIIKTWEEPLLPRLCRVVFFFMIVLTVAMLLVDISAFIRSGFGISRLLYNISTTGFWCWMIFTLILVLLCFIGARQNTVNFYRRQTKSGISTETEEDRLRSRRAVRRLNASYARRIKICLIGMAAWAIFYFLTRTVLN